MEEQTHTSTTGQPKKKQSGCATCLYLKSPSEQLQMKYALFPSSVDVLSGWPDFSNLLFIALLSLPCFPPLTLPLEFGRAAGQTPAPPAHRAPLLPLTHYGLSPSAWKPEWTSRETHPRPWESNQAPYTGWLSCELGLTPVPGESLGLLGEWVALGEARSDPPHPVPWWQDCYTRLGCHTVGRLPFTYRSGNFLVIYKKIHKKTFSPKG